MKNNNLFKKNIHQVIARLVFAAIFFTVPIFANATILSRAQDNLGLVGYWSLNEKTGSSVGDSSGNNFNGSISGGTSWVSGKLGNALKLNGSDGFVTIPDNPALNSSNITISFWVKFSSVGTQMELVSKGSTDGYRVMILSNNTLKFGDRGNTNSISTVSTYSAGRWYHVVAVGDSGGIRLYVDGVVKVSNFVAYGGGGSTAPLRLGVYFGISNYLDGTIDDVRIYNRALSTTEVSKLYKSSFVTINSSQNNKLTRGLIGMWSFNGADINWGTNTVYDRSGQGNNGTLTNFSTSSSPAIGKVGQALTFNGTNSSVGFSSDLVGSGDITACAWVYLNAISNTQFKSIFDSIYFQLQYYYLSGTYYLLLTSNGSNTVLPALSTSPVGVWNHVCAVRPGGSGLNADIYLNGNFLGTGNDGDPTTFFNLTIGGFGGNYFNGKIDEARIYNRLLSASEIKQLYLMGK